MQSIKSAVATALQTSTALSTLAGFYFAYPNNFSSINTFPCLSYFEVDNAGSLYADNQEIGSEIVFQIDLWGKTSLSAYAKAVDSAMTTLEFTRVSASDLYEKTSNVYHKAMRYKTDISDPDF